MFDPDNPDKDWRNRSLLSLQASEDAPRDRSESLLSVPPGDEDTAASPVVRRRRERGRVAIPETLRGQERPPRRAHEEPMSPAQPEPRMSLAARLRARFGPTHQAANDTRSAPPAAAERDRTPPPSSFESPRRDREVQRHREEASDDDRYWRPLIDPASVVMGVVRSKGLIAAATVAGALLGVIVALSTPKEYYSATELLFDPRALQIVDRELTGGGLPSDATLALIENQVRIVTSGTVLNKVVEKLGLANDPEFNGEGGSGLLSILTNPRSLFSFFGGDGGENPARRQALAVRNLAESLDVERKEGTFIILIGALTEDPEKSALVATTVADVFLQTHGEMQASTVGRANSEITAQLDQLRAEVERAERAVADFKAKNDIIDAQGRLITEDEIVQLNDQLSVARARTAELNARAASVREADVEQALGGALPEQVASPVMTELLAQYASLKQQADRAGVRLGPRHPDRQSAEAELAGAREEIARELRRINASIQVELQRSVQLEQDLASRLARLKVQKGDLENERVELRELEREAEARRSVYESFLLRARETNQQRDLNTANVSIISPAYPPLLPTGPSRASIAIAGTVLGFLAGVGLGAARGAYGSLRETMRDGARPAPRPPSGPGGPTPPGTRGRRREEDDFDPLPIDPPSSTQRHPSGWEHHRAWPEEPRSSEELERVRADLRAFRREVEELAVRRSLRRYG